MPLLLLLFLLLPLTAFAEYLGDLSVNPFDSASLSNPFSDPSTKNPYAIDAPRLYGQQRHYWGKLSMNPYDPNSVNRPYDRDGGGLFIRVAQ